MKTVKILKNQNKLYNEVTSSASYNDLMEEFSIRIVLSGNERYHIGKKNLTVYPGNFLVINEGTVFNRDIYSDVPANVFSILYCPQFLKSFHRDHTESEAALLDDPFSLNYNSTPAFLETIYPLNGDMMFNLLHLKDHYDSGHHNEMLINEYLYYCLLNFYGLYKKEILAKRDQLKVLNMTSRAELFKRLNNAKDYMLSNYNQPITIEEISQYACLSEIHFHRTFKQTYNCSPHQYLIQLRLNNARHMLKTTGYTVSEIVNLIGFDNTSSFIRLFRERFGNTPGSYRSNIVA
jgi:AraC family transcriptional regulator